ncbi:hypothetical protein OE88DRAFT_1643658 [Heliocybe sulcata]|uniref:Uncharacterized protein n=1 Tax=Heliocybe sulcata TaxID=5364 RepID=A0A5C3NH92_9AGAM|nr:hypothetical protein OE88DRAFT_1643658 [Heliocybe sulcata]
MAPNTVLKLATASVEQASSKSPPLLLPGDLTPAVLHDWRESCKAFCYNQKDLKPEDYVKRVAYGMRDPRLRNWYRARREAINAMSLEDYIKEMSARFLRPGWEDDHHNTLLLVTQGEHSFWDWANHIQSENTTLIDTPHHLSDADLRKHLNTHMHPETKFLCKDEKANEIVKFEDWLERKNKFPTRSNPSATPSSTSSSTARSATTLPKRAPLPKLTDDEKALLNKYHGCYKCRRFNVTHTSTSCPNGFPGAETYKMLTEADATKAPRTQAANSRPSQPVAAIIEEDSEDIVAAIVMPSAIVDDDEEDTDECVPISLPLLQFDCTIDGPSVDAPVPIVAMLDHGSGMTLISHALTQRLGLRRFRAPQSSISLSESVKISVSSLDNRWHSRVVKAIVTPGLCCDLLCGLTFQSWNHLVVNAESRSAIDQSCGYDLLQPSSPPETTTTRLRTASERKEQSLALHHETLAELGARLEPVRASVNATAERVKPFDVVAAARNRIESLTIQQQLSSLDADYKSRFADLFPDDIPHVSCLPTDIYHRI